jgi:ABC-type dipeptide/oligopeptide/nickel transport system permease subunit
LIHEAWSRSRALRRFFKNPGACIGLLLVALLVAFALVGPLIAARPPELSDFTYGRDALGQPAGPSARHLLGTDILFRDLFSRLAHGARVSLMIASFATAISIGVGTLVGIASGMTAGTRARTVDTLLMRGVDVGLSFPYLLLVMAIGAALGQTTIVTILLVLGLSSWFGTARIVRSKTLQVRSLDFITAARALGQTTPRILLRHVLPNVAGPVIVIASASAANMILAESVLSYLQLGLPPPTPSWGRMLYDGQAALLLTPRLVIAPGVLIVMAVLGFNLLGEGLRDALDPQEER